MPNKNFQKHSDKTVKYELTNQMTTITQKERTVT